MRLRLSQGELTRLLETGAVEEHIEFAPGVRLAYRLERGVGASTEVEYAADRITVRVPGRELDRWAQPNEIAIRADHGIGGRRSLSVLVEKDFRCLSPRPGEDDADLFPNPDGTES